MRTLYALLWWLALPLLPLRLWWRARREPGYGERIGERFGRYEGTAPPGPVLWLHAVSLGETRAAVPLVRRLLDRYPQATLLLTHMTATGRTAGRELWGERVVQAWLPYDVPFAVRGFLRHFRPVAGLLLETEVWPNLVRLARAADVPLFLVNARLSERSAAGYAKARSLAQPAFAGLSGVAAQSPADARRIAALGSVAPVVTGNLKFDVELSGEARALGRELRQRFGDRRPLWVAASTREGEEALLLDALARGTLPAHTLTVIVPRHPQRFDDVAGLLAARNLRFVRRSEGLRVPPDVAFVLGDSMGELPAYYAAADVAFVGGSLLPLGGQNLIEAIAAGRPTLVGPHMFNFADATANAVTAGAARQVPDADTLVAAVSTLLEDPEARAAMAAAAAAFHAAHRGAADRLWAWLAPALDAALAVRAARTIPPDGG